MLFGPVWSRRFGWSLGVDPFIKKVCTYSCPYCQLGFGTVTVDRKPYCEPQELARELMKYEDVQYDVITFVPKGEPLLDSKIWACAGIAKTLAHKDVVLLTNGSLLFNEEVRADASRFDVVSVKVDAGDKRTWEKINAPHSSLKFEEVIEGIKKFAKHFKGKLVTETMVIKGINDSREKLKDIANIIRDLKPKTAFIMIPTRPPAMPVEGGNVELAYQVFREIIGDNVVVLTKDPFKFYPKDPKELKRIAEVHPVPKELFEVVPSDCSIVTYNGREFVRCV